LAARQLLVAKKNKKTTSCGCSVNIVEKVKKKIVRFFNILTEGKPISAKLGIDLLII